MIGDFLNLGILGGNVWGSVHAVLGAWVYLAFERWIPRPFLWFVVGLFAWEAAELLYDPPVQVYGSVYRWAIDSAGDILLAVLSALAVRLKKG